MRASSWSITSALCFADRHIALTDCHFALFDRRIARFDRHIDLSDRHIALTDCHFDRHIDLSDRHITSALCFAFFFELCYNRALRATTRSLFFLTVLALECASPSRVKHGEESLTSASAALYSSSPFLLPGNA